MSEESAMTPNALAVREEEVAFVNEHKVKAKATTKLAPLALRHAGYSYEQIAEMQALPDALAAKKAVDEALVLHLQNDAQGREMSRALLASRLDQLNTAIWPKAMNPKSPDQLPAARVALEIVEKYAKLTGANAPTEHHVSSPSLDRIQQIVSELGTKLDEAKEKDIFADDIEDAEIVEESA